MNKLDIFKNRANLFTEHLVPILELKDMEQYIPEFRYSKAQEYLQDFGLSTDNFWFNRINPMSWFCYYKDFVIIDIPLFNEKALEDYKIVETVKFNINRLQHCIDINDFKTFFHIIDKRIALHAYQTLFNLIPDNKKYSLFWFIYSRCGYRFELFAPDFIKTIIKYRNEYINIPEVDENGYVTIFRGQSPASLPVDMTSSWTLDINTAVFYATQFHFEHKVYSGKIYKKNIIALLNHKREKEIIAFPSDITDIKEIKMITLKDLQEFLKKYKIWEKHEYYMEKLKSRYFYRPDGIHGLPHTSRVLFLLLILAYKFQLDEKNIHILCTAALYHDIGRTNDNIDPCHGLESYKKLVKYQLSDLNNEYDNELLRFIIENHCISDKNADKNLSDYNTQDINKSLQLFHIFKDADGLDRIRINDLDIRQLRSNYARELIFVARQLYKQSILCI